MIVHEREIGCAIVQKPKKENQKKTRQDQSRQGNQTRKENKKASQKRKCDCMHSSGQTGLMHTVYDFGTYCDEQKTQEQKQKRTEIGENIYYRCF